MKVIRGRVDVPYPEWTPCEPCREGKHDDCTGNCGCDDEGEGFTDCEAMCPCEDREHKVPKKEPKVPRHKKMKEKSSHG
jgi:hypothetical protein